MKPKDLKPVFTWEERRVLIQDRVWYFPEHYVEKNFEFPGWNDNSLFGNEKPISVEYCSGNGDWILSKAEAHPERNWVAVEKQFKRVRKIWSKMKNRGVNNLVIVCGEGCRWTEAYVPGGSVSEAYINFPDPWPKDRHAKHRIIKPEFSKQLRRILTEDGTVTLVTDDQDYSHLMVDVFSTTPGFVPSYPAPHFITNRSDYGDSYFDHLWRELGRTIRYHRFEAK